MARPVPLFDRLLVSHMEEERDRIILPDSAKVHQRGIVVAKGDDVRFCSDGDVVLFSTEHGVKLQVPADSEAASSTEELYLVPEPHVLAILEKAQVPF